MSLKYTMLTWLLVLPCQLGNSWDTRDWIRLPCFSCKANRSGLEQAYFVVVQPEAQQGNNLGGGFHWTWSPSTRVGFAKLRFLFLHLEKINCWQFIVGFEKVKPPLHMPRQVASSYVVGFPRQSDRHHRNEYYAEKSEVLFFGCSRLVI